MFDFPDTIKIEIGVYVEKFVMWLLDDLGFVFDGIRAVLLWFLIYVNDFLAWLPWWIFLAAVFLAGWRFKSVISGIVFSALIFLIGTFGYWDLMMYTLSIVLTSVLICIILGIPLGIIMAYKKSVNTIVTPFLDAMQTMPSFVYLIPAMMLFRLGSVPAVFATIIYAIPPVVRLTNLGIRNISADTMEAAISFGPSTMQLLRKVQLPQAMSTIMAGVNQTTMMALSMVVIASMVGAKGLGMEVLKSISNIDIATGFESGISIVILAIIIDRLSQSVSNKYKVNE